MKKIFIILFFSIYGFCSYAHHTKGGWMSYKFLGPGVNDPTKLQYRITLKMYTTCQAVFGTQIENPINITLFDGNKTFIQNFSVPRVDYFDIKNCELPSCNPCITPIPSICYKIVTYEALVELAPSVNGYTFSYQRCCRIDVLANVQSVGDNVGDTWTINIPGTQAFATAPENSSPVFPTNDTAIICAKNYFTYKFEATDPDGDSLSYAFVTAFDGAPPPSIPNPPQSTAPPYTPVPYISPFSAAQPLGSQATINPVTGLVSGIAPDTGEYVVTVLVTEYHQGVPFATSRKSLHLQIASCSPVSVKLDPQYTVCDSYSYSFSNNYTNPNGTTYNWDFGDPRSGSQNTSTSATATHTFSDTGIYKIKLTVSLNGKCYNIDSSIVRVYPFFNPGFIFTGQCKNTAIQFTDTSKPSFGTVSTWTWNFGDTGTANTSTIKNPTHTYASAGTYDVTLTATSSKGCSASVTKPVAIKDKPDLFVTNDTLICYIDTLQLNAAGAGTVFWTPNYNINNQASNSPLVSPDVPTNYYVTLTDPFGCVAKDTVFVDVKLFVTIDAGRDTGICAGDPAQLNPVGDALHYSWSPTSPLNDPLIKYPIATPAVTTKFYVIGNIGKCQSIDSVTVRVAPYPGAQGIPDTAVCIGGSVQMNASGGSNYSWSPPFYLNNANIPNPRATPDRNILYIVTITDTLGCPKPSYDTVLIQVQKAYADAGPRDTSIVMNQPLQLNGTGGQSYVWSPAIGLDNPAIANPIATLSNDIDYVLTASTSSGCFATDTISVKVFKTLPGIYVPSAFTPNGDGKNDVFRPLAIGIKQISHFKVFNRWGVMVYSSNKVQYEQGIGWNGTYKGRPQDTGVFVWIAEGTDYMDKKIIQKGTVTLVR